MSRISSRPAGADQDILVECELLEHVRTAKTAYEAWLNLCNVFEDKRIHRRIALLDKWLDTKHSGFNSLSAYVMAMKNIVAQINSTRKPVEDETAAFLLLRNLKPEYHWLRQLIERTSARKVGDEITLTFEDVSGEQAEDNSAAALRADGKFKRQGREAGAQSSGSSTRGHQPSRPRSDSVNYRKAQHQQQ